MNGIRQERTGWRDEALSERHRRWGFNCPCVDIDFLMIEYDSAIPVALIEYKHEAAETQYSSHASYRAMCHLGTAAGIPVLAVRYAADLSWFRVTPLNAAAKELFKEVKVYSEEEYVAMLYHLRGRDMPPGLLDAERI
jgi:hypothetical protein